MSHDHNTPPAQGHDDFQIEPVEGLPERPPEGSIFSGKAAPTGVPWPWNR